MFNPKVIAVSAIVGFILSFFVGLFSGVSFGYVLLRALISSFLFGVLGFACDFILKKFVNTDTNVISDQKKETGNLVDITIDDDVLKDDESGPSFFVDSKEMAKKQEMNKSLDNANDSSTEDFKPLDLAQDEYISNMPADVSDEPKTVAESIQEIDNKIDSLPTNMNTSGMTIDSDELEDLPDISGFVGAVSKEEEVKMEPEEKINVSISDSDVKDSSVMAQAIRTVLLKDG